MNYKALRVLILPLLCLLMITLSNSKAEAQHSEKVYRTLSGSIGFTMVYYDSVVIAGSKYLVVTLDHDLATIHFRVNFGTINTEVDSLLKFFHTQIPLQLSFKGNLENLDFISTESHPPIDLTITGVMMLNGIERDMTIPGRLTYYPQPDIASRLSMNFELNLEDFQVAEQFPGFYPIVQVEIMQAVLKKR